MCKGPECLYLGKTFHINKFSNPEKQKGFWQTSCLGFLLRKRSPALPSPGTSRECPLTQPAGPHPVLPTRGQPLSPHLTLPASSPPSPSQAQLITTSPHVPDVCHESQRDGRCSLGAQGLPRASDPWVPGAEGVRTSSVYAIFKSMFGLQAQRMDGLTN